MNSNEEAIAERLHALVHLIAEEARAEREPAEIGNITHRDNLQAMVELLTMRKKIA